MARLKYKWIVLVIVSITMLACDSESRDFGPNAISFGSNRRSIYKESLDNINAIFNTSLPLLNLLLPFS